MPQGKFCIHSVLASKWGLRTEGLFNMNEEWVTIQEAHERLGINRNKISRLASRGVMQSKANPLDARVRLIDLNELLALFKQYESQLGDESDDDDEP